MVLGAAIGLGARALPWLARGGVALGRAALPGLKIGLTGLGIGWGITEVGASLFGGKTPTQQVIGGLTGQTSAGGGQETGVRTGEEGTVIYEGDVYYGSTPEGTGTSATPDTGVLGSAEGAFGGLFPGIGKSLNVILPIIVIVGGLFILVQFVKK